MLIVFHALLHALFGSLLALCQRPGASSRTTWRLPAALYLDLLTAAPLAAYQLRLWPAYALGYAFDPLLSAPLYQWVPLGSLAVLLAMPSSLLLGYGSAAFAYRRGRNWLAWAMPAGAFLAAASLGAAHYEEFTVVTDFATYWRGGGTWAARHLHVQIMLLVYGLSAAALWPLSRPPRAGA